MVGCMRKISTAHCEPVNCEGLWICSDGRGGEERRGEGWRGEGRGGGGWEGLVVDGVVVEEEVEVELEVEVEGKGRGGGEGWGLFRVIRSGKRMIFAKSVDF